MFLIIIENDSKDYIHINKNAVFGYYINISESDIQEYEYDTAFF